MEDCYQAWYKHDPQRAVEEIKVHKEDRKLVSKFEAEHRDEVSEILGWID